MLERFLKLWDSVLSVIESSKNDTKCLTTFNSSMKRKLKYLTKILSLFEKFTLVMEGEHLSLPKVPVGIWELQVALKQEDDKLAEEFFEALSNRLGFILTSPNLALCAAALHPKYTHLNFITEQLRDKVWKQLEEYINYCSKAPRYG